MTYGTFYGSDKGEVVFDRGDGENILILGESFDNAIVRLLAGHFGHTYSVDLRYYENSMGVPFRLHDYLEAHNIDRVLLIGNIDFFLLDDFYVED